MNRLLSELRRRNVFRVAAAYLVAAWLVMQVIAVISDAAGMPDWADSLALILLIAGLPVVLFVAWAFELTPDGLKPTESVSDEESQSAMTGSKLDLAIISGLAVVAILMLGSWLWPRDAGDPADPAAPEELVANTADAAEQASVQTGTATPAAPDEAMRPSGQSVAVLPFLALSSDEEDRYFADGLTEEILNYLAAVPELMVTSRTSAFQYRGEDLPPIPEIARQLGVANIVEGSVRRSGDRVRVTVQIIRAADDAHLWSGTYDVELDDIFTVQEDIAQNITTVLDIVLDEAHWERMESEGIRNVDAYIAFQRGFEIFHDAHFEAADLVVALEPAQALFTEATTLAPRLTNAYLMQADYYAHLMRRASRSSAPESEQAHEEASERYFELLHDAWMSTSDENRRAMISVDRVYMSRDWSGADEIVEQATRVTGCPYSAWFRELSVLSGRAAEMMPYAERRALCDPLYAANWDALARIAYAAGEFDTAFAAASRGLGIDSDYDELAVIASFALMQAERVDEIRQYMDLMQVNPDVRTFMETLIAARAGDRDRAQEYLSSVRFVDDPAVLPMQILLSAVIGDRDNANAMAIRVDSQPFGEHALLDIAELCRCGALWDIDQTPNFQQRINQAGFPWPPEGGENFPLKTW